MLTPTPRVELPYTYLMAWFMMYCPSLMTLPTKNSSGASFIQKYEGCDWKNNYMHIIRKTVLYHQNFHIYRYFSDFSGSAYREEFRDTTGLDGYTTFCSDWWLINIRIGHLLYCQRSFCFLEPYFPSRIVHLFGYS